MLFKIMKNRVITDRDGEMYITKPIDERIMKSLSDQDGIRVDSEYVPKAQIKRIKSIDRYKKLDLYVWRTPANIRRLKNDGLLTKETMIALPTK